MKTKKQHAGKERKLEAEKEGLGGEVKKVPSKKQEKENLLGGTTRAKASLSQMPVSAATPVFTIPLTCTNPPPASADIDQEQMAMDIEDVQKEMQKVQKKRSSIMSFFKV